MSDVTLDERVAPSDSAGSTKPDGPNRVRRAWCWVERHPLVTVFVVALAARLALSAYVAIHYNGSVFGDEMTYSSMALQKASGHTSAWDGWTKSLFDTTATFMWPLTAVSWVTGHNGFAGEALVSIFGSITALFTAMLLLPHSRWAAIGGGLVVALLPSQVLWSSLTMKDAAVWAVLAGLALLVRTVVTSEGRRLAAAAVALVVALYLLGHLRDHTTIIACWAVVAALAVLPGRVRPLRFAGAVVVALALPAWLGLGVGGSTLISNASSLAEKRAINAEGADTSLVRPLDSDAATTARAAAQAADVARTAKESVAKVSEQAAQAEQDAAAAEAAAASAKAEEAAARERARQAAQAALQRARRELARQQRAAALHQAEYEQALAAADAAAKRAYRPGVDESFGDGYTLPSEGMAANARYLPKGVSVMLFWPYPWERGTNARVQLARVDTLLWYPALLLALFSVVAVWRRRSTLLFPVLVGGGSMVVSALSQGNFGTAYRHRGEFVWVVAVLAAMGATVLHDWWRQRRAAASSTGRR